MLEWENFEPRFGTWANKIKPFFDKGGFEPVYKRLKEDSMRGKKICPDNLDTFRALIETPYSEIKQVIVGLSPYHTLYDNKIIADGLLMSTRTNHIPPSLEQFYKALEVEFYSGLCLPCEKRPDLTYLAKQGILLWNIGLTCELNKAGSHTQLWKEFQKFFFSEIISITGVPVISLGAEAKVVKNWLGPMQWYFPLSHPAAASRKQETWNSLGTFSKVNRILKESIGEDINYFPTYEQWKILTSL